MLSILPIQMVVLGCLTYLVGPTATLLEMDAMLKAHEQAGLGEVHVSACLPCMIHPFSCKSGMLFTTP